MRIVPSLLVEEVAKATRRMQKLADKALLKAKSVKKGDDAILYLLKVMTTTKEGQRLCSEASRSSLTVCMDYLKEAAPVLQNAEECKILFVRILGMASAEPAIQGAIAEIKRRKGMLSDEDWSEMSDIVLASISMGITLAVSRSVADYYLANGDPKVMNRDAVNNHEVFTSALKEAEQRLVVSDNITGD